MKYVVNVCYGGFTVPRCLANKFGWNSHDDNEAIRQNAHLIDWVENHYDQDELERYTSLSVVEIPDNATDWELSEYDGSEEIIAVIDGKIVHI